MSCFAVSRLLKHKEESPPPQSCPEVSSKNGLHFRSKKASALPNVEIVQEVPRESSVTPVPPSSPQQQYQYQYHQYRHMSPHRSVGGSVPPSPALSGCRSPSRQRNTPTYSTLEVRNNAYCDQICTQWVLQSKEYQACWPKTEAWRPKIEAQRPKTKARRPKSISIWSLI